jgi:hypothetical protein
MVAPKGHQKWGGKKKGTPNKVTQQAREAIAAFVDGNAHRLEEWLDRIALDSPKDAFNCFQSVIEYHIPKLGRTEHTGKDGAAIEHKNVTPAGEEILKRYREDAIKQYLKEKK